MIVKYSVFRSLLKHSSEFTKENENFLKDISSSLGFELIESDFSDHDCDLKLLFVQTGGSEGIFLNNLDKLKPPFYLLTNGGNNSLAASFEILTYAKTHGYDGEILHGDASYIAKRIISIGNEMSCLKKLSNCQFGVIGEPSDWLISSIPDEDKLREKLGIRLKRIPLSVVEKGIDSDAGELLGDAEYSKADKFFDNLKRVVFDEKLDGVTIRCFDLLSSIKMTGCLALAKLNDMGITSSCEGDIMALISMHIVRLLFDLPSFQANPSRIDPKNSEIIFAHCTVPYTMLDSYEHMTHFESGIGLAIRGKLKECPVTVFRLSSSLSEYTLMEGEIVCNPEYENLCRTQIIVKTSEDLSELLKNPCGNHHIIFYGHKKAELESFLKKLI